MAYKTIKTHFSDRELDCHDGCGKTVSPELLVRLEALRRMINRPLPVTSGARCEAYNRKVGGKPHSWHLKGLAADIACEDGHLREEIIRTAAMLGFHGMGVADRFVHLDLRSVESGNVWLYSSSQSGRTT